MKNLRLLLLAVAAVSCSANRNSGPSTPLALDNVPVTVIGSAKTPAAPADEPVVKDADRYDAIVVGGGLAGLTSAVYLNDSGKKVLVLEKEKAIGGLAAWTDVSSEVMYDRGAAYWTDAYEEEHAILERLGLGDYSDRYPIPEPIDSYYVRGKLVRGIWDEATLEKLPASFALFHFQLQMADANGLIPNQPFEDFGKMDLDRLSAKQWIEQMPARLSATMNDLEEKAAQPGFSQEPSVKRNPQFAWSQAKKIWKRFQVEKKAGRLRGKSGMLDVTELMDLYCRSALGRTSGYISAMAFANFYISEITTRYTSSRGTGLAAYNMLQILREHPERITLKADSPVTKIVTDRDRVEVHYISEGQVHVATTQYVVFSVPLKLAPKLIEGFREQATKQTQLIEGIQYSDYLVHAVHLKGHPYRATYDTWMYPEDYTDNRPTDVILGRWMDPQMLGYEGYRDFRKDPPDGFGVLTIYDPLTPEKTAAGEIYDNAKVTLEARESAKYVVGLLEKLPSDYVRAPIEVTNIETSRWPSSVHVATPGYYTKVAPFLKRPFGRVFFGGNNLGTPAFEEALYRGHCAADNVLAKLDPRFAKTLKQKEPWTRCHLEK